MKEMIYMIPLMLLLNFTVFSYILYLYNRILMSQIIQIV
jgi:hypothetical protein